MSEFISLTGVFGLMLSCAIGLAEGAWFSLAIMALGCAIAVIKGN